MQYTVFVTQKQVDKWKDLNSRSNKPCFIGGHETINSSVYNRNFPYWFLHATCVQIVEDTDTRAEMITGIWFDSFMAIGIAVNGSSYS